MELDIVEEIARVEAEAEELRKQSMARVKELEKEAEEALVREKQALEEMFNARAEELRKLRQKEGQQAEAKLNEELAEAQTRLKELGEKNTPEAIRYILSKILSPASAPGG